MTLTSIGDLSASLMLRTRTSDLKARIERLTEELGTGQTADPASKLGGDYAYLADIDRNLSRLDSYALANAEATLFAGAAQRSLAQVETLAGDLGSAILSGVAGSLPDVLDGLSQHAAASLDSAMSALNGAVGGRHMFSGVATGTPPLPEASELLDLVRDQLTGISSPADVLSAIDAWFDDPDGFRAVAYKGADTDLPPFLVGDSDRVDLSLRADDPELRSSLRDLTVAVLATDADLDFDMSTRHDLMAAAGERLLTSQSRIVSLRADVGHAEGRLEEARVRTETSRYGLGQARNHLVGVDPFETATRLEEAQGQLEALYAVTVRNSRLSLMNFMS